MSLPDVLEDEIRRLEELRARNPRGHTFARLADLYRKSGAPEKGLEVVEEGLGHHPHYLNAHLIHARILTDLGRGSDAAAAFRRVLDIDDENLVARQALAALEPTSWLAKLEAEWRERREPAVDREVEERPESGPGEPVASEPGQPVEAERQEPVEAEPEQPTAAEPEQPVASEPQEPADDEVAPGHPKPEAAEEVATATLAELYLRQGLYEEAISVYEKLLARDPYSARLAASLDEARRLSREGSRRGAMPTPAVHQTPRDFPRPGAAPSQGRADGAAGLTIREQLTAILEERAPLEADPESGALRRLRRWLDERPTVEDE